jgi:hypothetical protein
VLPRREWVNEWSCRMRVEIWTLCFWIVKICTQIFLIHINILFGVRSKDRYYFLKSGQKHLIQFCSQQHCKRIFLFTPKYSIRKCACVRMCACVCVSVCACVEQRRLHVWPSFLFDTYSLHWAEFFVRS